MPSFVKTTITTPLKAKTEPTDKSNSPDTIRIVAPIAIKAISGEIVNRTQIKSTEFGTQRPWTNTRMRIWAIGPNLRHERTVPVSDTGCSKYRNAVRQRTEPKLEYKVMA